MKKMLLTFVVLNLFVSSVFAYEYIKPFVKLSHAGKIVFSHYGEDTQESPALKIYVVNEF